MNAIILTQHGSLLQEFVAGLKGHLLQRRGVGPDCVPVQWLIYAFKAHVVCYQ